MNPIVKISKQKTVFAAIALVALSGCATMENIIEYDESPQIVTTVSVNPDNPRVGDTIEIIISLENTRGRDIELHFSSGSQTGFAVFRDGNRITPKYNKAVAIVTTMIVAAGETKTIVKKLELSNNYQQGEGPAGAAKYYRGEYEVRAGISGHSEEFPWATSFFTIRQ